MPTLPKPKKRSWIKTNKQIRHNNNQMFYSSKAWRMTRKFYIKANPLCEHCKRKGTTTAGQMVDHIKPISMGGNMLDNSNLQTLCNKCHAIKSAYEGVEYRKQIKNYVRKK